TSATFNIISTQQVPTHLAFLQQPTDTAAGATVTPAVTVQLLDVNDQVVSGDNTDTVTIAIANNPGAGTLGGTLTVTVVNGVATFSDLSINRAGSGYTLSAKTSAANVTGTTSGTFNIVVPLPATHLVFQQQPTTTQGGVTITPAITVLVEDATNQI